MKYTFADGRNRLYQWDQNVVLNLPEISDGTEVHFAMSPAVALKRVVGDGQVTIPDILLQKNRNIIMFVYLNDVTTDEGEIEVIGRPRPPEYVYIDPEKPTGEDIVDSLNSTATDKALSANQGRILDEKIGKKLDSALVTDNLTSTATTKPLSANQGRVLDEKIGKKLDATGVTEGSFLVGAGAAELAEKTPAEVLSLIDAAQKNHGNHVPTTEAANNARFLRSDNTWQTVTPANIGAAPAGYGIGKLTNYPVASDEEIDSTLISVINGMDGQSFKRVVLSCTTVSNFTGGGGHWYTDIYKLSLNYAMITIKSYVSGRTIQRVWYAGALGAWEWWDPPMLPGVEYRTTKRRNGAAVYAKRLVVDLEAWGSSSAITSTTIPHGSSGFGALVTVTAKKGTTTLPYVNDSGNTCMITYVDIYNIGIRSSKVPWTAGTWTFDLEYTK